MKDLNKLIAPLTRNPDLTRLWAGQMLSQIGTKMYQIAVVWWFVSHFEGTSGVLIGGLLIFGVLPGILFVKWIGQLVERSELRAIILRSDLIAAIFCLLLLCCVYFGIDHPVVFFIASFVLSLCQGVIDPAVNKFLPRLSTPQDLTFAVALVSTSTTFASFLGALCGALAIAAVGLKGGLALNALSYALSYWLCTQIKVETTTNELQESQDGQILSVVKRHKFLVAVMIGFATINLFLTPVLVTMPIYIKRVFNGDAYLLGLMEAYLWAGMLLGAFATGLMKAISDVLVFGFITLFVVGCALLIGGLSENLTLYSFAMFVIGAALGVLNVRFITMFQEAVPDQDKGRFFALLMATVNFMTPVGFFGFGALTDAYSVTNLTAVQGAGVLVVAVSFLGLRKWRSSL